jgi:hypothetical protein
MRYPPAPVELDMSVIFQVVDARRVATEIGTPMTRLYNDVFNAARGVINHATANEIRMGYETIASMVFTRLKGMNIRSRLGIEVKDLTVTRLDEETVTIFEIKDWTTIQEANLKAWIIQNTPISLQYLYIEHPEIIETIIKQQGALLQEYVKQGINGFELLPSPTEMLIRLGVLPAGHGSNYTDTIAASSYLPGSSTTYLPSSLNQPAVHSQPQPKSPHDRMQEEIDYLKTLPGSRVVSTAGLNDDHIPDGSYVLKVDLPRSSGGKIEICITCSTDYPASPPDLTIEVDGQYALYDSDIIRRWNRNYLIEIVRDIQRYAG